MRSSMANGDQQGKVRVIGFQWNPISHEIKDFLARNRVSYEWRDLDRERDARALLQRHDLAVSDLPAVIFPDGTCLSHPDDAVLAEQIGLSTEADSPFYDLVIVGAGPAGMAAAVYGASEGVRTLVLDREAPGGQAGLSASIENYLGFPGGVTGADLAQRGVEQARQFGVEVVAASAAVGIRAEDPFRVVRLEGGEELYCHTVLLAMGVAWRTLQAPGCRDLIGRGIYYGAAGAEASACQDQDVYLLGGGNSAGQAAVLLARFARTVTLVAPEEDFGDRMSEYLLQRLQEMPNVRFRGQSKVVSATGDRHLEHITVEDVESGRQENLATNGLFVFIGAAPETEWLDGVAARDERGFIQTGPGVAGWPLEREPFPLEASLPGVFVAGDVRAGSVKRIGAAVGEGSAAVQYIHAYLGGA